MRPTLLVDADDTLWENEVYYEECIEDFSALMSELGFRQEEVAHSVNAVERERVPLVGYAPQVFARNLVIAYERLCESSGCPVRMDVAQAALEIGRRVIGHPVAPFEGVKETLEWLKDRFQLIVLTKGDPETQEGKLARSGLRDYFEAVHVVHEKDVAVLRALVEQYELDPGRTWMVGNSPRSDINPAVEAGIGAIYVPHANTWDMEQAEIASPESVIELARFGDLVGLLDGSEGSV